MIRRIGSFAFVSTFVLVSAVKSVEQRPHSARYCWPHTAPQSGDTVSTRFAPPSGFERVTMPPGSFGEWLRGLPLLPGTGVVHLHNGSAKPDQQSHAAVIDIDVGRRDLQQCADAVIRLRAEYLFAVGDRDRITFRFTSGDLARYSDWRRGLRPSVKGSKVTWSKQARPDNSYAAFRAYCDTVFTYAGTLSLAKELVAVVDPSDIQPGDVFIDPGAPGHAEIVVDVVRHTATHRRVFLLAQSFMPAQQLHILRRSAKPNDVWFEVAPDGRLSTPHWDFQRDPLRRFRPVSAVPDRQTQAAR